MKRLLFILGMAGWMLCVSAQQINRVEYFWDTDPGFGSGIALPIMPGDTIGSVFGVSTVGLSRGLHTLYIRSRNTSNVWSVNSKRVIYVTPLVFGLASAEYFFDTDPGFGNGTPLNFTPGDSLQLAEAISTVSLTPGLHFLYVRTKDSGGKWSVYSKRAVYITQPVEPIAAAEYFVDTDPGFGNGTPISITPGDSVDLIFDVNTTGLPPGLHHLYVRLKDSNNRWGDFSRRHFYVTPEVADSVEYAEYFVDTDPGFGNGTSLSITPGDSIESSFQVSTTGFSHGFHTIFFRSKDSNEKWSVYSKRIIYVFPEPAPIVSAEYFIDTDPGVGNGTPVSVTPGDSVVANFQAPTGSLLIGPHWVYVRVQDTTGKWSVYSRDSFYVDNFNCLIYGNGEIELTGDTCRGSELTFKDKTVSNSGVNPADYSYEWDFFNDGSVDFTDSVVNYTFNETGTDTVVLKVYETNNSVCQEIITKIFAIRRIDTTYSNVQICDGQSHFAGGANQTESGTYYDTYSNLYGCDSVHVTNLTVIDNLVPSVSIIVNDDSICSGTTAVFTATPVNGGTPYYVWKVDGNIVGQGYSFQGYNPFGISTLADGDVVTCEMTSSETCVTGNPAVSNSITMDVTQSVSASVTIAVDTNGFCSGTTATFSVTDTTNPGSNPQFVWYLNNFVILQNGGTSYSSSNLGNGNNINCYLYSDEVCVNNSPVASNTISMIVTQSGYPEVSISPSANNVCYGTSITFTASTSFGGNNPNYEWFLNGNSVQNGSSNIYSNDSLDDNDEIRCVLTSDYECRLGDTDTSNAVMMDIIYNLPVSVNLVPSGNNICEGTGVTFYAYPTNAGNPNYQFFVNGNSAQNGSLYYYSYTPANGDSVWVVVTSDILCATNNPATSDKIHMTVIEYDTVSVSISVTEDSICEGTEVIFTANPVNPGVSPNYLWRVGNQQMQYGPADTFAAILGNGSAVSCELYADHQCTTPLPAVSNSITMSVTDTILPVVLLSVSPQTTICQGTQVDFTATLFREGNSPLIEWLLNNNVVQTSDTTFSSDTLKDFDVVRVRLTTDYSCPMQNPVLSNPVVMTVIDSVTPSVFVYHGPNPACTGNLVSVFTTTSTGGDAPTYEFRVDGNLVQSGINSSYSNASFNNGEVVQVTMYSNAECLRNTIALSNFDTIKISPYVPAGVSIQITQQGTCLGDTILFEATPVNEGSNPIYTWRVNNVVRQSGGSNTFSTAMLQDGDDVFCEMNSSESCVTNNPALSDTITVQLQDCGLCASLNCADTNICTFDTCVNGECYHVPIDCNDNNSCTIDRCDTTDGCQYTIVQCNDNNLCTIDACQNGDCEFLPVNCNDENACTDDFCIDTTGLCGHSAVTCADDGDSCTIETCNALFGCISAPKDCSDSDSCTNDFCQNNACVNSPIVCEPDNACFTASCDNGQCIQTLISCNDNSLCTSDGCDIVTGCVFSPVSCDDASVCTLDSCHAQTGCFYTPIICRDTLICTIDACDSALGCTFTAINCDDDNPCTNDFCDTLGLCVNDTIPNCGNPCDTLVCIDNSLCTDDACENGVCVFTVITCSDANLCTADDCDPLTGCTFTLITCSDNTLCTSDDCDALAGCIFTPIVCADNNLCTADDCDDFSGCLFTAIICNDNSACTTDTCDAVTGCAFTAIICDDSNPCTTDNCDLLSGCAFTLIDCNDGNPCTNDTCDAGFCSYDTIPGCGNPCDTLVCIDNNLCTTDECLNGQCEYTTIDCNDGNACTLDSCSAQTGCFYTTVDCNDNDACTDDSCELLYGCQYNANNCDDNSLCTLDSCDSQAGCFYTNVDCNDNDACTDDACHPLLGCQYSTHSCDDNSLCTLDSCDSQTGCFYTAVVCDDGDLCTTDSCFAQFGCIYSPVSCDDSDSCTIDKCEFGVCVNSPVVCNDGNLCTNDTCIAGNCFFTPIICADNDACTNESCEPALGCIFPLLDCNDGNGCTDDFCDLQSGCYYLQVNCDDNDACTVEYCELIFGCQYSPVLCDDADLCTTDACDVLTGCIYTSINCDDGEICTSDFCNNGFCEHLCSPNSAHEFIWQKSLGGSSGDGARSIHQTNDGGYIVTGYAFSNNGDISGNNGQSDFWVAKLDGAGNLQWQNALGGDKSESANSVKQTTDGGYILAGNSKSNNDDVSANHGGEDFWVVKLDAAGNLIWQKTFGGNNADIANSVEPTSDGGYIVGGWTSSNNQDVSGNHGGSDFWVIKLDIVGNLLWQKALGGTGSEQAHSVQQTNDGGYIAAGYAKSNNGDVSGNHGGADFWLTKLDAAGNLSWQKTLGGSASDIANSVQQTDDGGYIAAGSSKSSDGDVSANNGGDDFWLVKLDVAGNLLWEKNFGGTKDDIAQSAMQTTDSGYFVSGSSKSNDGDVSGNNGDEDFWTIRLDASGVLLWQESFGGNKNDRAYSSQQTNDEGYVIAGLANSHNTGDVTGHHGSSDFWVVKLAGDRICKPVTEISEAICLGDSVLFAGAYLFASGTYYDTLTNHIGCDSIIILTLVVADCNDGDPCTADACINGACTNTPLVCDDGDVCTIDDCDIQHNGCFFTPVICNDNDLCTTDECHFGSCIYQPIICNDNNPCTIDECVDGTCEFNDERTILSFTLVDAGTDSDIAPLLDGDTINLALTPLINIRANVCATSDIESVKFLLDGNYYRIENIPFYTIAGDNNGNYNPWNITPGVYTIHAIPYSGNNGTGTVGIPLEITIVIIDGLPQACTVNDIRVTSFMLVNPTTDTDIGPLADGAVIDLSVTGPINIRANVFCGELVGSVKFKLNGASYRTEGDAPYSLAGDNPTGNYHPWNVLPGVYTILATPYSGAFGSGTAGTPLSITITVIGSAAKMSDDEESTTPATDESMQMSAYPNPFSEMLTIEFMLARDSHAQLEIFNLEGQRITQLFEGDVKGRELRQFEFTPGKVSDGMFIYRLQTSSGTYYGKAVMVR